MQQDPWSGVKTEKLCDKVLVIVVLVATFYVYSRL